MSTLSDKVSVLREQLGYTKKDMPMVEFVAKIEHDLGLSGDGLSLVQRVDKCCEAVGITGSAHVSSPVPMVMAHSEVVQESVPMALAVSEIVEMPEIVEAPKLNIHEARYGWAGNLWSAALGSGHNHGGGAKDVTDIVRRMIVNDELHINPNSAGQYMNRTFWVETAGGPAIPRKLGVKYSYGGAGIKTAETPAVPNETVALHVPRASYGGTGGGGVGSGSAILREGGPVRIAPQRMDRGDAQAVFDRGTHPNGGPRGDQNLCCLTICCAVPFVVCPLHCLSAWGCADLVSCITSLPLTKDVPCFPCSANSKNPLWCCGEPLGWAASMGQLHTVMALVANGAEPNTKNTTDNNAYTDAARERHQHVINWLQEWEAAGRPRNKRAGSSGGAAAAGTGSTSTGILNGCWVASVLPIPIIWALYYQQSIGPDRVKSNGLAFFLGVVPCPFEETRTRLAGTNRFVHDRDGNNVLRYDNPLFNCFPSAKKDACVCNLRLCCAP
jgi:hypothetical protein